MTRRRDRSLRAQARAFLEKANPDLSALAAKPPEPSLTERARALYEDSVVTVTEIARLCGVTERTILKYSSKQNWKPRYRWRAGKAGERHRGWQPEPAFAPAKGAGARFVKREEAGKAFPVGLKANDPAGAAQAMAACETAQALSATAEQEAAFVREMKRRNRAYAEATSLLFKVLAIFSRDEEAGKRPRNGVEERTRLGCVRLAVLNWEIALAALSTKSRSDDLLIPGS